MRTAVRSLTAVALLLGYGAAAACSGGSAVPTAPSPGLDSARPAASPTATGSTTPGVGLTVVPRSDGSFDMTEDLRLSAATDVLQLQLPASGAQLPGLMSPTNPQVTNLNVIADDQSVPLTETTLDGPDYIPLIAAATRIRLTYRLSGSAVLATPSRSPRAGAVVRPLTASADGSLPTDVTVTSGLLNAVCPLLPEPRCAVGDPPHLAIEPGIPAGKALVVLQLDLPR
ncbi:hypothetical protein ACQHIV_26875 [Kribbella sp. GL6]|uniref:hypothetical protein n=1 Tax=Kribbella sp. GL6 TaxID=3419765 RepID=UPI003D05969B